MRVRVLLFAALREAVGAGSVEIEVRDGATVGEAREELERRFEGLRGQRYAFALDHEYVTAEVPLGSARELALIPPVSGG